MSKQDTNEFSQLAERQTASEEIFDGVIMHVFRDTVALPDGSTSTREILRHIGAVCVIPVTDEGNVILERQYRYPLGQVMTEIPAGKLDYPEEDRLSAIQRELLEETGYTADCWQDIGLFYPAAAYSDEKITMYLATKLHRGEQHLDQGEFLNVFEMPLKEALAQVMSGEITDSKTQTAIMKAANILGVTI
ncbi:MAG: NUDIX hydrolase [Lachnospiraceae bacterium]|nr:NUDIX hydrolase [Lachnospiraceae bacterium]